MVDIPDLPVWSFRANWSDDVNETLEWQTGVSSSEESGFEQRRQERLSPRRSFEFSVLLSGAERVYGDLLVRKWGSSDWLVPIYHDAMPMDFLAAGSSEISGDTTFREFAPDTLAVIFGRDARDFEIVSIESVTAGGLVLTDPVVKEWGSGRRIYPLRRGYFTEQPTFSRRAPAVSTSTLRVILAETNDYAASFAGLGLEAWGIEKVLTIAPNQADDYDNTFARNIVVSDNGRAIPYRVDQYARAFGGEQARWLVSGREENAQLRGVLYALAGKMNSIWIPTFGEDMVLDAECFANNDRRLLIQDQGLTEIGDLPESRRFLQIVLHDGRRIYRGIRHVSRVGAGTGQEVVDLDFAGPDPAPITPAMVKRISFMDFMRLDTDSVEIAHHADTDGASSVETVFRSDPLDGFWLILEMNTDAGDRNLRTFPRLSGGPKSEFTGGTFIAWALKDMPAETNYFGSYYLWRKNGDYDGRFDASSATDGLPYHATLWYRGGLVYDGDALTPHVLEGSGTGADIQFGNIHLF